VFTSGARDVVLREGDPGRGLGEVRCGETLTLVEEFQIIEKISDLRHWSP